MDGTTTMTTKQEIVEKIVTEKSKPYSLTTEIFAGRKDIPAFISDHKVFKTPLKINKIFPSIGLKNFKEPCELAKPLLDLKKENFVSSLVAAMLNGLTAARDEAMIVGDRIQFLLTGDDQDGQLGKIDDVYNLMNLVKNLIPQLDTYNNNYERIVQAAEGKIVLRLVEEVCGRDGKAVFRKNESLFKVFAKLRDQFTANNLNFMNLEQAPEFKTFCAENVPNKKYQVVFSADGSEGAWDILTMSMRGIKSCQRWDGDYPRCLIGSILSKFVGIIYITSGADYEFSCVLPGGQQVGGNGLKMMRRALVRYAIDADEHKPCLLIERLYPTAAGAEVDEETLQVFIKALSSKTSLPVHFAPSLGQKVRHFYVPFEQIRTEVAERDWTYQDTPLKTNLDFQLHVLSSASNEDVMRYINGFRSKLVTQMGESFRNILTNRQKVDEEVSRTIANIRLNSSIDKFHEQIVKLVFDNARVNTPKTITDPKDHYRKYLIQLALNLKNIKQTQYPNLVAHIDQNVSRAVNHQVFCDFIFNSLIKTAITQELKSVMN
jgi:hypothetical protein